MKRILLASASIVAFAGAAAAQDDEAGIFFGGDASLGFNESEDDPDETGFFFEANLDITFRTILDNGLVAESTFSIPIADTNIGNELSVDNDFVLGLSVEDRGALVIGDVEMAGEEFTFANMQSADFSEQDNEVVLRGESVFANINVAASTIVLDQDGDEPGERGFGPADDLDDFVDQIAVGGNGSLGRFVLSFGYQEESDMIVRPEDDDETTPLVDESETFEGVYDTNNGDFNPDEQFGIAMGTDVGGLTLFAGYGANITDDTQSYGIQAIYSFGLFDTTAEFVYEPDAEVYGEGAEEYSWNLGVAYDTGNLIVEAEFGEEIGEEEYDIKVGYSFTEITSVQAGYNDDDGTFLAYRQGLGAGAFVEASYSETEDAGFGNDDFVDDVREGTTIKVGLEF